MLAWVWLDVALCARRQLDAGQGDAAMLQGKLAACTYFFHYELPRIGAWLAVVETRDATCAVFPEDAF